MKKLFGKTYRKPYRGSRRFDRSCRNHGSCDYCVNGRTYQARREQTVAAEKILDAERDERESK